MFLAVLLTLHSLTRWAILASTLALVWRAASGWRQQRAWSPLDASITKAWVGTIDLQIVLGFVLYFVASPMAAIARQAFGAAMKDRTIRFFAVEHPVAMLLVAILTHATSVWARRADDDATRYRRLLIGSLVGFAITMLAIPWPFLSYGRPLFRL
ncbi:MAG: hypothetical protein K0S65_3306 [Labilithrix sp.]|nr:hypothetical protein [Labilithrix sp.]